MSGDTSNDTTRNALLERLAASRALLLAALEGVTERDFGSQAGEQTVVQLLASLARAERAAVGAARGNAVTSRTIARPAPPQVMHDLAGARYETRRYIEQLPDPSSAASLVAGIETREAAAAQLIRERRELPPAPVIPVIQP